MCFHGPCGRHQYDFTQPRFLLGFQTKLDQVAEFAEVATEESTVKVFLYRILLHPTAPSSTELDNRLFDDSLANSASFVRYSEGICIFDAPAERGSLARADQLRRRPPNIVCLRLAAPYGTKHTIILQASLFSS